MFSPFLAALLSDLLNYLCEVFGQSKVIHRFTLCVCVGGGQCPQPHIVQESTVIGWPSNFLPTTHRNTLHSATQYTHTHNTNTHTHTLTRVHTSSPAHRDEHHFMKRYFFPLCTLYLRSCFPDYYFPFYSIEKER